MVSYWTYYNNVGLICDHEYEVENPFITTKFSGEEEQEVAFPCLDGGGLFLFFYEKSKKLLEPDRMKVAILDTKSDPVSKAVATRKAKPSKQFAINCEQIIELTNGCSLKKYIEELKNEPCGLTSRPTLF